MGARISTLILGALIGLLMVSCDPCRKQNCSNQGDCIDGECICDRDYEGENCDIPAVAKFFGSWNLSEDCISGSYAYAVEMLAGAKDTLMLVVNLANNGDTLQAVARGDSLRLLPKIIANSEIAGQGVLLSSNEIRLIYTQKFGGATVDSCVARLIR